MFPPSLLNTPSGPPTTTLSLSRQAAMLAPLVFTRNSFSAAKLLTIPLCTTTNSWSGPEDCGWLLPSQGAPCVAHLYFDEFRWMAFCNASVMNEEGWVLGCSALNPWQKSLCALAPNHHKGQDYVSLCAAKNLAYMQYIVQLPTPTKTGRSHFDESSVMHGQNTCCTVIEN